MPDSPFTAIGDEPVEARIVSWVLGEASAFEAAELERLCEERPELLVFRRRMRALHGLLTEAEAAQPDDGWKLPEEKRKVLDEIFGAENAVRLEVQKETRIRHSGRRAFLAIAACLVLTLVVLRLIPWKQVAEAEVTIEVKPRALGLPMGQTMSEKSAANQTTPQFFATEFEKIKSRNSLEKVVDNLELSQRWGVDKETALQRLKDKVKTQNIRGTDLISVRVQDANETDAKDIADEVTKNYVAYRSELESKAAEAAIHELNKAVRDQEDKVEERRKVLSTIVRTKGIIYKGADSFYGQTGVNEDQAAQGALQNYHQLEQEKQQLESQITSLLKYDGDQLMMLPGLNLPDNPTKTLLPQYQEEQRKLDGLKISGYGDDHPTVRASKEQIENMKKQIDEGVVNLRAELKAKLDLTTERLKSVAAMKDSTREEAIKRGLDAQDYVDAKREFETEQELLQQMKLKLIGEDITRKMGNTSVVVHDQPVYARKRKVSALDAVASNVKGWFSEAKPSEKMPEKKVDFLPAAGSGSGSGGGMGYGGGVAMKPLTTELPKELIEGTPKPMNVPNLKTPINGPAGSSSWAGGEGQLAENKKLNTTIQPSAPAPPVAPPPVAARRSKSFAMSLPESAPASTTATPAPVTSPAAPSAPLKQAAKELAEAKPEEAPAVDAFAMKADSDSDPFAAGSYADSFFSADETLTKAGTGTLSLAGGAMPSDAPQKPGAKGLRSGDAGISAGDFGGLANSLGDVSGEMPELVEKKKAQDAQAPAASDMPVLGNLFSNDDKNGPGKPPGSNMNLSGANTYNGGTIISGGPLGTDGVLATDTEADPKAKHEFRSRTTADQDIVFSDPDGEGKKLVVPEIVTRSAGEKMPELEKSISDRSNASPSRSLVTEEVRYKIDLSDKEAPIGTDADYRDGSKIGAKATTTDTAPLSGLAGREMIRRQAAVQESDELLSDGREAYAKGDYQQAVDQYSRALEKIPDAPMNAERLQSYKEHLSDASVAKAMQDRKVGKYDEARKGLEAALKANPDNEVAKQEAGLLDDPIRTNPALTQEHAQNVDKLRRDLYKAEGNYNLGKYDDAKREYENALRTDPYNAAARRGLEKIASAKSDYYRAAYGHTRAELLSQVDAAWELKVPADGKADEKVIKEGIDGFVDYGAPIASGKLASESQPAFQLKFPSGNVSLSASSAFSDPRAELLAEVDKAWELAVPPDPFWDTSKAAEADKRSGGVEYEIHTGYKSEYLFRGKAAAPEPPKPNLVDLMEEIAATDDAYSTFSLNISDASFQVAQAALAKGERPAPAGIKVEQFYNAVDYGDPAPTANEPVAVNIEQSAHPIIPGRNLVRVALKTAAAGRSASQPLRLTLLVDQSGSMVREDRRAAMGKALASLSGLLTDKDSVTVIGFSRTPRLLADAMAGDQAAKLKDLVNQSASEGGTNLEEAIKLGEQMADRHKQAGAQNRIVLFTDGAANLGNADPVRLAEKVKQLRQKGVSFDIAGIAADGLNDELLGELARNGNGRYYVVGKGADDDLGRQLAGAFRPAAENVKVQVRFNPERVGRYKLIGFEKDRLKTEDFRNDKVDAAELAADEAGVAVYQVEPLPGGSGELGEVSVRFRDAASGAMVERGWTIPHDDKTPAFDRATPSMQLATLAMLAAEKLKGGPLAEAIDFQQLAEPRANVKHYYGNNGRVGEVLHMLETLK